MAGYVLTFVVAFIMGFTQCYTSFRDDAREGETFVVDNKIYEFQERK